MVCSVPEDDERIIPVKRPQDFIVCGRFIQSNSGGKAMCMFGNQKFGKIVLFLETVLTDRVDPLLAKGNEG